MASSHVLTRQKLIEIAGTLPPAPRVFAELHALLKDINTDIERITGLIKRDASLAAQVLRVSNSVVFRSQLRAGSVEDAVNRIGFQEVYRIVGLVSAQRLAERALLHYEVSAERLREQMVETAFVCEALAPECGLDARTAYTAGLMRPIGILVLDRVADLLKVPETYDHERDGTYLAWEGRHFGMGNSEVAGLILSDWAFPNEIVSAIRDHYLNFENATSHKLACLVNLACSVVASDGRAMEGELKFWEVTDEKLRSLGMSAAVFAQTSKRALKAYAAYRNGSSADSGNEGPPSPLPVQSAPAVREGKAPVLVAAGVSDPATETPQKPKAPVWSWRASPVAAWPLYARSLCLLVCGAAGAGVVLSMRFLSAGCSVLLAGPLPSQVQAKAVAVVAEGGRLADLVRAVSGNLVHGWAMTASALIALIYLFAVRLAAASCRAYLTPKP